jgi:hypothetical protein
MGKYRRGNYVFVDWKSDHAPKHVHVFRNGQLVLKWDLENQKPLKGKPNRRILELIDELQCEGKL